MYFKYGFFKMTNTITLWTATFNEKPKRFLEKEAPIWATPEKELLPDYGTIFWELEVELPPEEKGWYIYSGQGFAPGQSWGHNPGFEGVGAYVFKARNIVSRKRVLEKLSERITISSEEYSELLKKSEQLLNELEKEKRKWKPIPYIDPRVKEKAAAIAVAAFSLATVTLAVTVAISNISALNERRNVEEQVAPQSPSNCMGDC